MADLKKRVPENVPGDFFVDSTCIDCNACRQIAPSTFGPAETSFVKSNDANTQSPDYANLLTVESRSVG